jgi:hypothetical protein
MKGSSNDAESNDRFREHTDKLNDNDVVSNALHELFVLSAARRRRFRHARNAYIRESFIDVQHISPRRPRYSHYARRHFGQSQQHVC